MQRIMSTYFERWKFKHPRPSDFFDIVREVTGHWHYWFFDEVYRSSNTFDYGVQEFLSERVDEKTFRTSVVVRRYGEATFPVDVVTTFENGEQTRETWNGQERRAMYVYRETGQRNNRAGRTPTTSCCSMWPTRTTAGTLKPSSGKASLKWSLKWMVWLQDLMLTYGFFV